MSKTATFPCDLELKVHTQALLMWEWWHHKHADVYLSGLLHTLCKSKQRHQIIQIFFLLLSLTREHLGWPAGATLLLSKLLIACCKCRNYTSSWKCKSPVVKWPVWGWWYNWAHLESLSSTNEPWWKTNVSGCLPPVPPVSPAERPGCVYPGWDEPMATARLLTHNVRVREVHIALGRVLSLLLFMTIYMCSKKHNQ